MVKLRVAYMRVKNDHNQVNQMFNIWASLINQQQPIAHANKRLDSIEKQVNLLVFERVMANIEQVS